MPETSNTPDRIGAIAVMVATLAMVAVNAAAAGGLINGVTPAEISARFPTVITPAGYAFSIWTVIYAGLLVFSIYQMRTTLSGNFRDIRRAYIASCVLNCAWIVFWHYSMVGVCLVIITLLALSLLVICYRMREPNSFVGALITKAPFGVYFGWVTCAVLINLAVFLGTLGIDAQHRALGIAFIIIAAIGAFLARWKLSNYLYPLAVAWALGAIAVEHSGNTPIVITAAFATVGCLVTAGSVVTSLKDSTSE